ncbi:unnamed protein product [[Candida] boidinii]|nr:unnamed protein product [[Candida] boidinii]
MAVGDSLGANGSLINNHSNIQNNTPPAENIGTANANANIQPPKNNMSGVQISQMNDSNINSNNNNNNNSENKTNNRTGEDDMNTFPDHLDDFAWTYFADFNSYNIDQLDANLSMIVKQQQHQQHQNQNQQQYPQQQHPQQQQNNNNNNTNPSHNFGPNNQQHPNNQGNNNFPFSNSSNNHPQDEQFMFNGFQNQHQNQSQDQQRNHQQNQQQFFDPNHGGNGHHGSLSGPSNINNIHQTSNIPTSTNVAPGSATSIPQDSSAVPFQTPLVLHSNPNNGGLSIQPSDIFTPLISPAVT